MPVANTCTKALEVSQQHHRLQHPVQEPGLHQDSSEEGKYSHLEATPAIVLQGQCLFHTELALGFSCSHVSSKLFLNSLTAW